MKHKPIVAGEICQHPKLVQGAQAMTGTAQYVSLLNLLDSWLEVWLRFGVKKNTTFFNK